MSMKKLDPNNVKLIVAGSRHMQQFSHHFIDNAYNALVPKDWDYPMEVVSGGATGVDAAGERWAHTLPAHVKKFPADWEKHGKAAGPKRNRQMALYGDALLLIWDGESKGSANMKQEADNAGIPVFEVILKPPKRSL